MVSFYQIKYFDRPMKILNDLTHKKYFFMKNIKILINSK